MAKPIIGGANAPLNPAPAGTPRKQAIDSSPSALTSFRSQEECEVASTKCTQLSALLTCMYGVGQQWFDDIGTQHRDTLIWLASDLATDIERLMSGGAK